MMKRPLAGEPAAAGSGRSQPQAPPAADLEAIEAALIAEIEAFDLAAMTPPADEPRPAARERASKIPPLPTIAAAVDVQPPLALTPPGAAAEPAVPPGAAGGLLDQLRREARARLNESEARERELGAAMKRLDGCLRQIFSYCHELVQQLNVVKPVVERHYALLDCIEFSGLQWEAGFADYRTHARSGGTAFAQVTLSARLLAPRKLEIERDGIAVEGFRKRLFDNGIAFTCTEIRNSRRMVEKAVFSVTAEVKLGLRWRADLERGVIVLESRNLERFGNREYTLAPAAVTPEMLDHFARKLLGHPNSFRDYCRL